MSVGNSPVAIDLNKNKTTLIAAQNGSGKSILLDAICFVLFGKAYRNINRPQLINSINLKHMVVEINFSVGKKKYKVVRGVKPNIFEIFENGKLVNQDPNVKDYQKVLEQQIIKMNFRAFTQVVVMGSAAYVPFMKLKPNDRREFIEDLLDIRVFSIMNKLLFQKIKDTKEMLRDTETDINSSKEIIKVIESHVSSRTKERDIKIAELQQDIDNITNHNKEIQQHQDELKVSIKSLNTELAAYEARKEAADEIELAKKKCQKKVDTITAEIDQLKSLHTCPTCSQTLSDAIKSSMVDNAGASLPEFQLCVTQMTNKLSSYSEVLQDITNVQGVISGMTVKMQTYNQSMYGNTLLLEKLNKELLAIVKTPVNDDTKKLKEAAKKIVTLDGVRKSGRESLRLQEAAYTMLQDTGIKSKIIKQYIPTINKLVNKYLAQLDFFCQFTLDEGFNEIVKSRHRDAFSYDSFSQGEKQRIDLALIFTWREISAMKNSVHTNIIVMDELLDSALDGVGMDLCFDLIKNMNKSNVFVVSHREAISDKFEATIKLIKKNNFTEIEK